MTTNSVPFGELRRTDQLYLLLFLPAAFLWVLTINLGALINGAAHYWFEKEKR